MDGEAVFTQHFVTDRKVIDGIRVGSRDDGNFRQLNPQHLRDLSPIPRSLGFLGHESFTSGPSRNTRMDP